MKPFLILRLTSVMLAGLASNASAQRYAIDWFTIDGGGGTSAAGVYSVSGTIGQPDAGLMTGGPYGLAGGFWSVVAAVQTPGAPLLSIERSNAAAIVSWPLPATGWVLDQTSTLTGAPPPWTPVTLPYATNATRITVTEPAPTGNRFYRLRKP